MTRRADAPHAKSVAHKEANAGFGKQPSACNETYRGMPLPYGSVMVEENFDVYEGLSWSDRARYGVYGVALDCADTIGKKNSFIDAVHKISRSAARSASSHRRYERALDFGCGGARLMPSSPRRGADVRRRSNARLHRDGARRSGRARRSHRALARRPIAFPRWIFRLVLKRVRLAAHRPSWTRLPELARVTRARWQRHPHRTARQRARPDLRALPARRSARNGFTLLRHYPIRRSARSRWMRLASSRRCPAILANLAARGEIASAQRSHFAGRQRILRLALRGAAKRLSAGLLYGAHQFGF